MLVVTIPIGVISMLALKSRIPLERAEKAASGFRPPNSTKIAKRGSAPQQAS